MPDLVQRLASDGVRWADAEFALARAEATQLLRHAALGIGVAVIALPVMAAALVIWAQAAVTALTPVLHGSEFAGLAVGLGLGASAMLLCCVAWHFFSVHKTQLSSPILRWLTGAAPRKDSTQ